MRHYFFTILLVTLFSTQSFAQKAPTIAVIDIQRLVLESNAAKALQKKITREQDKLKKEAKEEEEELKKKEKSLSKGLEDLSQDDLNKRRKEFQNLFVKAQDRLKGKQDKLQQSANKATALLREEIKSIVGELSKEETYALVLMRQNIFMYDQALDITDKVMERLNKKVKSIPFK